MIRKLHHSAYRCRDAEETRKFYEDFLGLPLAATLELSETRTGRPCPYVHVFFRMGDGSYLAFFDAPQMPFEFVDQSDLDLHLALEVDYPFLTEMLEKGRALGMDVRGVADHGIVHSIYFRDPNGYVIELAAKLPHHDDATDPERNGARERLAHWQANKAALHTA